MDFKLLNNIVLKNKTSLSYRNGEKLFQNNGVKNIDIREVDNDTIIYGTVQDKVKFISTYIKLSKSGKVQLKCNCELNKEARVSGNQFACKHIVATALKLLDNLGIDREDSKKEKVTLEVTIKKSFENNDSFNIFLYLKKANRIKISNISELEFNVFSKKGAYFLKNTDYSKEEIELLKKLRKVNFTINKNELRGFLLKFKDIHISLKIDSVEYNGQNTYKKLPLKFTLKTENNKIKLQTLKSKAKALDDNGTVFIYDRKVYTPPMNQCEYYFPIYKKLSKKSYVYIKEEILENMVKILSFIGDLTINDDVKNILAERTSIILSFYKKDENIYCKFKVKEYLMKSEKVKTIEEILFSHKFTKNNEEYLFLGDDEELFNFLKSKIERYCKIETTEELYKFKLLSVNDIKGSISTLEDRVLFNLNNEEIEKEFINCIESFKNGDNFYRFNNYNFIDFSDKKIKSFMSFLNFIHFNGKETIIPDGYEELLLEEKENINFIDILKNHKNKVKVSQPKELNAVLKDYQLKGLEWMENKKKHKLFGILADEMGLGKTIQAISFLLLNKGEKSMVITETSLVYNWLEEFKKFAPSLKVAFIHGNKEKRINVLKDILEYDVVLTSYSTLNMDLEYYDSIVFDNLIIDEGQNIKNSKSKVAKNVKTIKSETRFALTGTPIENNLMELWSIFDFLKPGYLFSEKEFKEKLGKGGEDELKYLKLIIKPFILRRTKKEVLTELPNKNQWIYYVSMTEKQKEYYKLNLDSIKKKAKEENNFISVLSFLTKLRQIALDPSIVDENYHGGSGKVNAILKLIESSLKENKKTLIFSQFTTILSKLKDKLEPLNIKYYYLDGSTKAEERVRLCEEFNNSLDVKLFLISLKAGGTGLNLTSAERVIHFDPWWNPAVENQATDRAHRIGQKNEVEVIKIISKDTIEENIMKLKKEKNRIISSVLSEDNSQDFKGSFLSKKEIEYLLEFK